MEVAGMTDWKWVRIPVVLHDRAAGIRGAVESERVQRQHARTGVRFYEVFEMALDALERERDRERMGMDHAGAGLVPGGAGGGDMGRLDDTGRS